MGCCFDKDPDILEVPKCSSSVYELDDDIYVKKVLRSKVIVVGPISVGKTTIINTMLENYKN